MSHETAFIQEITIGEYTISMNTSGKVWIDKGGGESASLTHDEVLKLESVIDKFFWEIF